MKENLLFTLAFIVVAIIYLPLAVGSFVGRLIEKEEQWKPKIQ